MLCAVDLGNTQTVIGIYEDDSWSNIYRLNSDKARDLAWLEATLARFFESAHEQFATPLETLVIGSVVPALSENIRAALKKYEIPQVLFVDSSLELGIDIALDNPHEIGADRFANALAALKHYGPASIVVDFGTATNMDVLADDGRYLGGVISPGLETSISALLSKAAKLSGVEIGVPQKAVGANTREALESGFYFGEVAKVEGLISRIEAELGYPCRHITTGGLCQVLTPLLQGEYTADPTLTLEGLRLIAELNPGRSNA